MFRIKCFGLFNEKGVAFSGCVRCFIRLLWSYQISGPTSLRKITFFCSRAATSMASSPATSIMLLAKKNLQSLCTVYDTNVSFVLSKFPTITDKTSYSQFSIHMSILLTDDFNHELNHRTSTKSDEAHTLFSLQISYFPYMRFVCEKILIASVKYQL